MMADMRQATSFVERTPHSVRFTIGESNPDGSPTTIAYRWSGVEGDPLFYQYNDQDEIRLATSVKSFNLEYMTRQVAADGQAGGAPVTSQDVVFHGPPIEAMAGSVTLLAIPKPSGTEAGDLLVAAVSVDTVVAGLAADLGWNLITIQSHTTSTAAAGQTFGVWYKVAGQLEPNSYAFTWQGTGKAAYGWATRFTGHDPSNPIHAFAHLKGVSAGPMSPAVTTTVNNVLVLRLGGFKRGYITLNDPGLLNHVPINMNRSGSFAMSGVSGGSGYIHQATAGASGTSTFHLDSSQIFNTVTVAIAPNPGD